MQPDECVVAHPAVQVILLDCTAPVDAHLLVVVGVDFDARTVLVVHHVDPVERVLEQHVVHMTLVLLAIEQGHGKLHERRNDHVVLVQAGAEVAVGFAVLDHLLIGPSGDGLTLHQRIAYLMGFGAFVCIAGTAFDDAVCVLLQICRGCGAYRPG